MEIGPQPHGVVRSNIYSQMKAGVRHLLDWVRLFNSGAAVGRCGTPARPGDATLKPNRSPTGAVFEGGCVDVFTMVKHIDYPRERETGHIVAAVHPQLQVRPLFHCFVLFLF